jgi:enoyl-CoA hydratase
VAIKSNELETIECGDSLLIRFTRPEIRNPLSVIVLDQLDEIIHGEARAYEQIVFTGSGSSFASGADLREIADLSGEEVKYFGRKGQILFSDIAKMRPRTIAAINGYCFGGALDLTLSCDHRIASSAARFAHPGTGLGIITGWGGTQRLPRLVGQTNALEMFFTASPVDADRALAIGLVDLVADDIFRNEILNIELV